MNKSRNDDDVRSYARKVAEMRAKQVEFFNPATRRPSTVGESKALEREVDRMTAAILDDRPGLFDRPAPNMDVVGVMAEKAAGDLRNILSRRKDDLTWFRVEAEGGPAIVMEARELEALLTAAELGAGPRTRSLLGLLERLAQDDGDDDDDDHIELTDAGWTTVHEWLAIHRRGPNVGPPLNG